VRECVRILRPETPDDRGTCGVATRRFTYMGYGGGREYVQALRDIVVAIMIEKPGTAPGLCPPVLPLEQGERPLALRKLHPAGSSLPVAPPGPCP
jgi:hypothetical protein